MRIEGSRRVEESVGIALRQTLDGRLSIGVLEDEVRGPPYVDWLEVISLPLGDAFLTLLRLLITVPDRPLGLVAHWRELRDENVAVHVDIVLLREGQRLHGFDEDAALVQPGRGRLMLCQSYRCGFGMLRGGQQDVLRNLCRIHEGRFVGADGAVASLDDGHRCSNGRHRGRPGIETHSS